jgi:hypothetical protein
LAVACTSSTGGAGGDEADLQQNRDCNLQQALCEIPVPHCPSGQTPSVTNGCFGPCVPIAQCKPGSFACNQGGPATCELVPPHCPPGQTLTTKDGCFGPCVPSNVCSGGGAPASAPDCDISKTKCEIPVPHCPSGQTPSVSDDGFCFGPCVAIAQCKPQSFNCNQGGPALCEVVPPRCAPGESQTTKDGCFGPCVPESVCRP